MVEIEVQRLGFRDSEFMKKEIKKKKKKKKREDGRP